MVYSLARMRMENPQPPFHLGGEYLLLNNKPFVRDAMEVRPLEGDCGDCQTGDLIEMVVTQCLSSKTLKVSHVQRVQKNQRERKAMAQHAVPFACFVDEVRSLLKARGLIEVFTPTLVTCPGLEPSLEAFSTTVTRGSKTETRFLPTSPEIHLKKAMARGLTDIFEIKSCFRRGEYSPHHAPEFLMLEWYRGFADLERVIEDLQVILARFGQCAQVTDFQALFKEQLKFDLRPDTTAEQLMVLVDRLGISRHPTDTFTDLFHRIMLEKIEPQLSQPLIIRRFPPEMAALSRLDQEGWADRFEFYWNGLEIANAFNEVTDPVVQAERWAGERSERRRLGTEDLPEDPELIEALQMGLPPTGGIALGLERLYMAAHGLKDISELRIF